MNHIDPKIQEITNALTASTPAPWLWDVKQPEMNKQGGYDVGDLSHPTSKISAVSILTQLPNEHGVEVISAFRLEDANLIANAPEYIAYLLSEYKRLQEEVEQWKRASETHKNIHLARLSDQREMKKALEWYADKDNYDPAHLDTLGRIPIDEDEGARARAALSHLKGE